MSTFYLKYRPQTVGELDLVNVREQLSSVLKSGNIPHAFLFSGPRGLGKTSAARILAKAVNCLNKSDSFEPCGECDACLSITKGTSMDVIEIDGASNRGIDDIRTLREGVLSAPVQFAKKVYVIDEVHMLTKEAFNALLKTLEEPPEHVMFVLATTEPNKVPETIISRCFQVLFQRATKEEIERSLNKVVKGENLDVDSGILDQIIEKAQGGFRDSMKMLEQLAFVGGKIDQQVFEKIFPHADVDMFLDFLFVKDGKSSMEWIIKQQQVGVDWEETLRNILIELQSLLLSFYGVETRKITRYESRINSEELQDLIELFLKASGQIKFAMLPDLVVQVVVAEWCDLKLKTQSSKLNSDVDKQLSVNNEQKIVSNENVEQELNGLNETEKVHVKVTRVNEKKRPLKSASENDDSGYDKNVKITGQDLKNKWDEFLLAVKPHNHSVAALLKGAVPMGIENGEVVIKVFYSFHKDRLEDGKSESIMKGCMKQVFACVPRIRYILGEKEEKQKVDEKKDKELVDAAAEIFS